MTTGRSLQPPRRLAAAWLALCAAGCSPEPPPYGFASPAPDHSRLPHLTVDARQRPVLSWVESRDGRQRLAYAVLGARRWEAPVIVAEGSGWFVNWADFPSVEPLDESLWAAHWLVEQPGGMNAYDIALSLSRDGGRSWDPPFRPHRDGTPTEHGFVSLWPVRLADGSTAAGAVWLDGRHTLQDPARSAQAPARTVLRSAVFDGAGAQVFAAEVDGRVCDCCQTAVAVTAEGALVAYRNRSDGEVRDIHLARLPGAAGESWQQLGPVAEDNWVIDGCPVNGPALAAGQDVVAVAWYTEGAGRRRVQVARRTGGIWQAPAVVDEGPVLGRVAVALLADGDAAVSWIGQAQGASAWILLGRVGPDGAVGEPLRVAAVETSRPAGFPHMVRYGDELLLAWTRWQDGVPRIVIGRVPASAVPPASPRATPGPGEPVVAPQVTERYHRRLPS